MMDAPHHPAVLDVHPIVAVDAALRHVRDAHTRLTAASADGDSLEHLAVGVARCAAELESELEVLARSYDEATWEQGPAGPEVWLDVDPRAVPTQPVGAHVRWTCGYVADTHVLAAGGGRCHDVTRGAAGEPTTLIVCGAGDRPRAFTFRAGWTVAYRVGSEVEASRGR